MAKLDLLVKNGEVWTPGGFIEADIAVHDGKIVALGKALVLPDTADQVIDAKGKIAYKAGRGPFGFRVGEMEQALVMALLEGASHK